MSALNCPECGNKIDLFGQGGGERQARGMGVLYLGALPINIETRVLADSGMPIVLAKPEIDISIAIMDIIGRIQNIFTS